MVELDQFATVAGLAALIVLILGVCGPRRTNGESTRLPYYAVGLGMALSLVVGFCLDGIGRVQDLGTWLVGGILAGLTAVGYYQAAQVRRKANGNDTNHKEVQTDG